MTEDVRRLLHDVRDPLTTILARLEMLRVRMPEAAEQVQAMIGDVHKVVAILDGAGPVPPPVAGAIWDDGAHGALRRCRRVLQVDDAAGGASPLRALLVGRAGCEVEHVGTVGGALGAIDRRPVDLAVVDWWLGAENTEPVLAELARRGVPTVVVSGDADAESPAARHGAGFVRKPAALRAQLDALVRAVAPL